MGADGRSAVDAPPVERVTVGTRTSRLAAWQADRVAERLRDRWPGLEVEITPMTTEGDRALEVPLPEIGGKGLFTAELEAALFAGEIDCAVHSLKDLPTDLPEGLGVVAVPERGDPRDALVWPGGHGGVGDLPEGAVVGTSSLRRQAQLLARRPDLEVRDVRGNVETRVEKCREGPYEAVVLAAAGLKRLGLEEHVTAWLDPPAWLPAAAQGALAVEARTGEGPVRRVLAALDRPEVAAEAAAERAVLAELGGGCRMPLGARGRAENGELTLQAVIMFPDGSAEIRGEERGETSRAGAVGRKLGRWMREQGADRIVARLEEREAGRGDGAAPDG